MPLLGALLILVAVVLFGVEAWGRAGRPLLALGLAFLAAGLLFNGIWPVSVFTLN